MEARGPTCGIGVRLTELLPPSVSVTPVPKMGDEECQSQISITPAKKKRSVTFYQLRSGYTWPTLTLNILDHTIPHLLCLQGFI